MIARKWITEKNLLTGCLLLVSREKVGSINLKSYALRQASELNVPTKIITNQWHG